MKQNFFKINSVTKLSLINTLVGVILASILYFFLPYILNYPPNSIDNDFQLQTVGLGYSMQYFILVLILAILIFFTFRGFYRKLSSTGIENSKNKEEYIKNLRKHCFDYPYFTLIFQTFIPPIICAILLVVFKTNFELLMRICIVILSVSAIYAITSYIISKGFFEKKLIQTSSLVKNQISGIRLTISKKLIIQTFPLFLYSSVILLLLANTVMTTEKGDLLYHSYRQELLDFFPDNYTYSIEDVKNTLTSMDLNSEQDEVIILSAEDGSVYYAEGEVTDFLKNYTLAYYDDMEGQCFDYYGQNSQVAFVKLHTTSGDYYAGIRFFVFASNIYAPFLIVATLTVLFNILYIYYIGKSLSNDIDNIVNGLKNISNLDNVILANNLSVTSNDEIGDLTLEFNKIQDLTKQHVEQLKDNQDLLMEKERLASLGQLIGGIAHNLKTPIMSISGAAEGLKDLIKEYDSSIEDTEVTTQDHHDIAKDMSEWVEKIKEYTEYMSDVITAVKGQAVVMSEQDSYLFTIDELVKRVDLLMRHELKNALINLKISIETDRNLKIRGNVNSLVQVINNMISNSIQAYNGKTNESIEFKILKEDDNIILSIKDYAGGLPKEVSDKLFKEMITTKGKNGTGLGLFMSYSNIRAHFNGNITFSSTPGVGTEFKIILPIK